MPAPRVRVAPGRYLSAQQWKRLIRVKRKLRMRRAMTSGLSKAQRKGVLSLIKRQEETKYVANNFDSAGVDMGAIWTVKPVPTVIGDVKPAIPQLGQGVGDYQRIGTKVNPTSLAVSIKVGFSATDLSANALYGVIFYGTDNAYKTWKTGVPLNSTAFLDNGDGTNKSWSGLRNDLNCPIDTKLYNLKRKVFRLTKTAGIQNNDIGGAATPGGDYSTSNGMSTYNTLLKFKVPKTLKYDNEGDLYPMNFAPFYYIGFCHADGSLLTDNDKVLVQCSSKAHMYYKDA